MNSTTNNFSGIKVGDKVLYRSFGGWLGTTPKEVTKVSPKFFWVGDVKFRISNGDEYGGKWGNDHKAIVYTDEMWEEIQTTRENKRRKTDLENKMFNYQWRGVDLKILEKVNSLLTEMEEKRRKQWEEVTAD